MENNTKEENKKSLYGIHKSLLFITIFPLILIAVIVVWVTMVSYKHFTYDEMKKELRNTALIVSNTYDNAYPGDYTKKGSGKGNVAILKGEKVLNNDYTLLDSIKEETGNDVTVFYGNTRVLTTITDDDGDRITGTTIRKSVLDVVMDQDKGKFYESIKVNNKTYFAYYMPVNNGDECVGMIAVIRSTKEVRTMIIKGIIPVILVYLAGLLLIAYISYRYSKGLRKRIKYIDKFLTGTSEGNFKAKLNKNVYLVDDEISEMSRVAEKMQYSLRKLVEMDALTEIPNRRYGDKYLMEAQKNALENKTDFAVAIADIDFFKKVNDTYGHQWGDIVLKNVAAILREGMAGKGFVARWGGEEFLMVFAEENAEDAYKQIELILNKIRYKEFDYNGTKFSVTMTCGLTEGNDEPVHVIVKRADDNLYEGKQSGRDRIILK